MRVHFTNPRNEQRGRRGVRRAVGGFTLLEVLVAVTITLILMGLVVEVFSRIGKGVNNSRANMELNDQLRNAKHRLIMDLRGVTAPMTPPLDPFMNLGYFEYVEGPRVASTQVTGAPNSVGGDYGIDLGPIAANSNVRVVNSVIGDTDDILMFTTASYDNELFVGKGGVRPGTSIGVPFQSRYAEVAWFLRRAAISTQSIRADNHAEFFNLHRRTWLVLPDGTSFGSTAMWASGSAQDHDISASSQGGNLGFTEMPPNTYLGIPDKTDPKFALRRNHPGSKYNSLGDLTRRECRSVHQQYRWPFEMMYVVSTANGLAPTIPGLPNLGNSMVNPNYRSWDRYHYISLPTLAEQSQSSFPAPSGETVVGTPPAISYRLKNQSAAGLAPNDVMIPTAITTITSMIPGMSEGARIGEDIILTNVVGFDVKAWDPGAPVFAAPMADTTAEKIAPIASILVPGDPGYNPALQLFMDTPGTTELQPVGFGAYADLNYMGADTVVGDARKRWYAYGGAGGGALATMAAGAPYSNRCKLPLPQFAHPGEGALAGVPIQVVQSSGNPFTVPRPCVYDTWSTHYEFDGINNDDDNFDGKIDVTGQLLNSDGIKDQIDELTNGADDNNNGLIDEPNAYNDDGNKIISGEQDAPPPYRASLRGIKITVRVMELDSKQVREITVVQEFIPL